MNRKREVPTQKAATDRNPVDARTTDAADQLRVEELEERIAPKAASNHNETLLADA